MTVPFDPRYGPPQLAYGPAVGERRSTGIAGVVIATLGGIVTLTGFFTPWYTTAAHRITLRDLVNLSEQDSAKPLAHIYLGWAMWVLFGLVVTASILANFAGGASPVLRVLSPILGVAGAGLLYAALSTGDAEVFDDSSIGLYLTLVGFVVTGLGGVLGPQRHQSQRR